MKWAESVKARRPPGFIEPCIPTVAAKVPEGPMWVHEIKHDGYRLIVRRSGARVRLFTRRGFDWSDRYPRIVVSDPDTSVTNRTGHMGDNQCRSGCRGRCKVALRNRPKRFSPRTGGIHGMGHYCSARAFAVNPARQRRAPFGLRGLTAQRGRARGGFHAKNAGKAPQAALEAVVSDERGIANFEQLHSHEHDKSAMLWAFDLLELNGEDLRQLTLDERKSKLAKLLKASRHHGILLNEHLEADGERAFYHACALGFEGIVSKRRDSKYVSGRSEIWVKVKNPNASGVLRFRDQEL
jgi:ATP-dependent DNA ligase